VAVPYFLLTAVLQEQEKIKKRKVSR